MGRISPLELILMMIVLLMFAVPAIAFQRLFLKAGRPAWKAWIPAYNILILTDIVGRARGWGFLLICAPFIPSLGILVVGIVWLMLMIDLAKVFGKSTPFAVMLTFIPVIPLLILAFSDAEYREPSDPSGPAGDDSEDIIEE